MYSNHQVRKITTGFQVTLPHEFRKSNNLHIGSMVSVHSEGDKVIIEPFQHKSEALKKLKALFNEAPEEFSQLSEEDVSKIITTEIRDHKNQNNTK